MASCLDDAVVQALNTGMAKEAAAASDSRTRSWDVIAQSVGVSQVVNLGSPTVMTAQGVRMLNGTPGNFANEVSAK